MTINTFIFQALNEHYDSLSFAYPTAYAEEPFEPLIDQPFLQFQFSPDPTNTIAVNDNSSKRHSGRLQITVNWPRNQGLHDALELAGVVIDNFRQNTIIETNDVRIKIPLMPWLVIIPGLEDEAWLRIPVTISYVCFGEKPNIDPGGF